MLQNLGWGEAIEADAAERGATVLLSATRGNATISYGNIDILAEWLRKGRIADYLREIDRLSRAGHARWRGAIFYSADEIIPRPLSNMLAGRSRPTASSLFINKDWFARVSKRAAHSNALKPDVRRKQYDIFTNGDVGIYTKGVLAKSGLDERDPCTDIRLVNLCLALPDEAYLSQGQTRRLARVGLRGVVPDWVLDLRSRGYQGADWVSRFDIQEARNWIEDIASSANAPALLDVGLLGRAIDQIARLDFEDRVERLQAIGHPLLRALAVGAFIKEAEIDARRIGRR